MFNQKLIYLKVYANNCKDALLFQSEDISIKPKDIVMISLHGNEVPAMVIQVSRKIKKTNIKPEFILRKAGFFEKNKFSLNPEEFCEIGYQFGIIGNSWNKKKGKGRIFSWVYDENSTGKPNYNYDFEIHYSIAKKLLGNTPIFKK